MTDTTPHLDERLRRPSGIRSLTLGDTKLSYVPDGQATLNARMMLPEVTDEFWAQHAEYLADIEAVALTHLHNDHFGWAWYPAPGSDRPAFTGTDILVAEPEWTQRHFAEAQGMGDMIKVLAPQVRTVAEGEEIFPGVRVRFTPGHSAGHAAYVISVGGKRVIAFGDAFHTPLQITHPLWRNVFDFDHQQSTSLRCGLIDELAQPDTIGFGIHLADMPFGRVRIEAGERQVGEHQADGEHDQGDLAA